MVRFEFPSDSPGSREFVIRKTLKTDGIRKYVPVPRQVHTSQDGRGIQPPAQKHAQRAFGHEMAFNSAGEIFEQLGSTCSFRARRRGVIDLPVPPRFRAATCVN